MELEKKELEYAYQLQLKDMEYQLKLQVLHPHIKTNKCVSVSGQQTTIECNNQPHGYVYIIQEREFYLQNIPVYKIGKTNQNGIQRYSSYPKGSKLILHIECSKNCHIVERKLIQLFKTKYNQRTDIGTEYFEGSKNTMINDVYNLAVEQELTILNDTNGLNDQVLERTADAIVAKESWICQDKNYIDAFLNDYEITNEETDFVKSSDIEWWINMQDLGITMKKFGAELTKYATIHKLCNVYVKGKKINGKSVNCWFGIKKIESTDECMDG
jgi:hypothetical protein